MTARLASLAASWALLLGVAAPAEALGVRSNDCQELTAFVRVPTTNVEAAMPGGYLLGQSGMPEPLNLTTKTDLIVRTFHCARQTVAGHTRRDVNTVIFGPEATPTRAVAAPATPGFSFYTFFWASDNPDYIRWLRAHNLDSAIYVPTLRFSETTSGGKIESEFDAPPPTPSPFVIRTRSAPPTLAMPLRVHWWTEHAGRTYDITNNLPIISPNTTGDGSLEVKPGTQMATMFDGATPTSWLQRNPVDGSAPKGFTYARFHSQLTLADHVVEVRARNPASSLERSAR